MKKKSFQKLLKMFWKARMFGGFENPKIYIFDVSISPKINNFKKGCLGLGHCKYVSESHLNIRNGIPS